MPLPPSVPPDLRIFARAIWPQITAGIAVNSQPHVNERTAKMRLQIATGGDTRNRLQNSRPRGRWCFVCHRAVVMKLGAKSRPGRLSVRDEHEFGERKGAFTGTRSLSAPQHGKENKKPDEKLTGVLVLATSYSRTAYRRTTIGAAAFHFRVRNGNGWCHHANVTRGAKRTGAFAATAATPARVGISEPDDSGRSPLPEIFKRTTALS